MNQLRLGLYLFVIISFSLPTFGSTTSHNFDDNFIDKALSKKSLKVSSSEKKIANNLAKVFEITEKGYINIGLTKKVLKQSRNYSVFKVYKDWLQSIISIHSQKDLASMRKTCNGFSEKSYANHLKSALLEKSVLMCFNQYLKLLSKTHKLGAKAHATDLDFFQRKAEYVSHPANIDSLSFFLSRFEKDSPVWKSYSETVARHFMNKGISPSKTLLQYMDITPELTRFIQVQGFDENSSKYVLYNELKKLIKVAYKAADKEKSDKKVRKLLKGAINYYSLSFPHLPQEKSNIKMLSLGKSLARRSYFESARDAFEAIVKMNPSDENTIFEIMWTYLTQEKYSKAYREVVLRYKLDKNFKSIQDDRLQFWTGYTLKQVGEKKYKDVFEDLISKSALNYYSIIASKQLSPHYEITSEKIYYQLANKNSVDGGSMPKMDVATQRAIKRFKIWGSMDFKPLINLEKQNAFHLVSRSMANDEDKASKAKAAVILLSAAALKEEKNYLESFKMIYKGLGSKLLTLDQTVLNILFPKPYLEQVSTYTKSFDPLIALSLIRQESGFNHKATSWVGARGLMQLMPDTAKMYWRGIKKSHLYNPKINIRIGSKYLSMLLNKYENNLVYALSAYNAGESRVKKWRKEYLTHSSSILHNIENIPFPETRKYVKLIFRNLFFYKMLDQKVEVADSEKVNQIFDVQLGFNQE